MPAPRESAPTQPDAAPVRQRGVRADLAKFWSHVPVLLTLALGLSYLSDHIKPDWLRATDGVLMKTMETLDQRLASLFEPPAWWPWKGQQGESSLRPSGLEKQLLLQVGAKRGPEAVILTVTPAAHADFLQRATPTPRARMACLIDQLALRIQQEKRSGHIPAGHGPVVGIDVDLATVERRSHLPSTQSQAWGRPGDESDCLLSRPPWPECRVAHGDELTVDDAMHCALERLATVATVVTLVYPRGTPDAVKARNAFIKTTCKPCLRSASCLAPGKLAGHVLFASPHLIHKPGTYVLDYPVQRLRPAANPQAVPGAFPGFGVMLAGAWTLSSTERKDEQAPRERQFLLDYCTQVHATPVDARQLDDTLADPRSSGEADTEFVYRKIRLGEVKAKVSEAFVEPAPLLASATQARNEGLASRIARSMQTVTLGANLIVLTLDTGTTEDRFVVPVLAHPVTGAWVHAAIALSVLSALEEGKEAPPWADEVRAHDGLHFWKVAGKELLVGAAIVVLTLLAHGRPRRERFPTLHHAVKLVAPLLAAAAVLWVYAEYQLVKYNAGEWNNPLPMVLGTLIHVYIDAHHDTSAHGHADGRNGVSFIDNALTLLVQLVWAALLIGIALNTLPHLEKPDLQEAAGIGAILYVALARIIRPLPLLLRT